MKDIALVKKAEGRFAEVLVESREGCHACAARALCAVNETGQGTLRVLNPIEARPGDQVEIEVPETAYSRNLILFFGLLIGISIAGAIIGTVIAPWIALPSTASGVAGFFVGAGVAALAVWRLFRRPSREVYPVITAILNQGGLHG